MGGFVWIFGVVESDLRDADMATELSGEMMVVGRPFSTLIIAPARCPRNAGRRNIPLIRRLTRQAPLDLQRQQQR